MWTGPASSSSLPISDPIAYRAGPADFAQSIIGGLLSFAFPDPGLRDRLGLVAGSPNADSEAGWYVWLAGQPGAYSLDLSSYGADDSSDLACLALRYYPSPDETAFHTFSPNERALRSSVAFDRTGTPAFGSAIESGQFDIAQLTLIRRSDDHFAVVLSTQTAWPRISDVHGAPVMVRNVAGLTLAAPVMTMLVSGAAYLGRTAPSYVALFRSPGLALHDGRHGRLEAKPTHDAQRVDVIVDGLVQPGRVTTVSPPPWPQTADDAFVHRDRHPPHHPPTPIEAVWWQAADWSMAPVGVFCATCLKDDDVTGHAEGEGACGCGPSCGCKDHSRATLLNCTGAEQEP